MAGAAIPAPVTRDRPEGRDDQIQRADPRPIDDKQLSDNAKRYKRNQVKQENSHLIERDPGVVKQVKLFSRDGKDSAHEPKPPSTSGCGEQGPYDDQGVVND
jgi:hypothetical protein